MSAIFLALFPYLSLAQNGQPPTIIGVTIPATSQSNALLRARFNPNTTGTVQAWFNWGKTTNIANRTPTQIFTGATNSIVFSNLLAKLATNQTYYFRCTVSNRFGVTRSPILTFKTKHDVQFLDLAATNIESDSASLTATFSAQHSGKTWFKWGTASNSVPNTTPPTDYTAGANPITTSNLLTGLTPNKTYYYRLMASNQFGISGSAVSNFTTTLSFSIDYVKAHTYVSHPDHVALEGVVSNYWNANTVWFEWGTNVNNYLSTTPMGVWHTPYTYLDYLMPNTIYYFRMVVTNVYGRLSTPWQSFTTPSGLNVTTYPSGSGNSVPTGPGYPQGIGAIGSTTARLGAFISNILPPSTDAWFEWGTSTNYEHRTPIVLSGLGSFEIFTNLTGLQEAGAIYHYRAVASNSIGMEFGADQTFSTPLFPLAVVSSNLPGVINGRALWLDYDTDGWLDVLVAGETATGGVCHIWRNDGATFSKAADLPPVSKVSFALGDHDNDGRLDILLATYERLQIWRNHGAGFSNINAALPGPLSNQGTSVSWADYDNDGRIDILVDDRLNLWQTNRGLGTWRNTPAGFAFQSLDQELMFPAVTWIDYDNDGWNDIVFKGYVFPSHENDYTNYVWRNTRSGFVQVPTAFDMCQSGSLAWCDYDNDGRLDAARPGLLYGGVGVCEVWRNTGTSFTNIHAGLPPVGDEWTGATAFWGDYDNDGRSDLLIYGYNRDSFPRMDQEFLCEIWRNTGTGFSNINAGLPKLWDGSATWGDYDNDGRLDVLMTGREGQWSAERVTHIYRNVHAPPNTPPTAPTGLQVLRTDFGVAFTWLAATDAQTPSSGLSYNIRVGSTPGGVDIVSPNALPDGKRLLLQLGNAQMRRFAYLTGLTNGQTIYWTVQAIDTAFAGGPFALEESFTYPPPNTWSAPALSPKGSSLTFSSALPLPFSIYTSTNLLDWHWYANPAEISPNLYQTPFQPTNRAQFFQLRSP